MELDTPFCVLKSWDKLPGFGSPTLFGPVWISDMERCDSGPVRIMACSNNGELADLGKDGNPAPRGLEVSGSSTGAAFLLGMLSNCRLSREACKLCAVVSET